MNLINSKSDIMMIADDLILFAQVIDLGSFAKAAQARELTNSVVSKRISRLEEQLGTQLFYRTTRKLTLTEAGKRLSAEAKNVVNSTQQAFDSVAGFGEKLSGHIKMSAPTISGDLLLADAIAEFCQTYSQVNVDISLDNQFVDLIEEGYDLVIRTGKLEDSSLIARHLIDSHWVLCASPDYIKSHQKINSPKQLTEHNCLLYTYQSTGANEWMFKGEESDYSIKVSGNFSTNNASALRKASIGGYGIAYVPKCLVYEDLCSGRLSELLVGVAAKKLGVYAITPNTKQPVKKISLLIEKIRQKYIEYSDYF